MASGPGSVGHVVQLSPLREVAVWGEKLPANKQKSHLLKLVLQLQAEIRNLRKEVARLKGDTEKPKAVVDAVCNGKDSQQREKSRWEVSNKKRKKEKKQSKTSLGGKNGLTGNQPTHSELKKADNKVLKKPTQGKSLVSERLKVPKNMVGVHLIIRGNSKWTDVVKTETVGRCKYVVTSTYGKQRLQEVKRMVVEFEGQRYRFTGHKAIWSVLRGSITVGALIQGLNKRRLVARSGGLSTTTKKADQPRRSKAEGARIKLSKDLQKPDSNISIWRSKLEIVCGQWPKADSKKQMTVDEKYCELRMFMSEAREHLTRTEMDDFRKFVYEYTEPLLHPKVKIEKTTTF